MVRRMVFSVLVLGAVALAAAPAGAAPPLQEVEQVDDHFLIPAGEFCDFPVQLDAVGRVLFTTFFDGDGNVTAVNARPNIRITLTNPANDHYFTDRDIGLDREMVNADGSSDVLSTAIHFRVFVPGVGIVFRRIGLQIIHIASDGTVIGTDIVGGNFDDFESFDPCAVLE
jgi:hypothetical protein